MVQVQLIQTLQINVEDSEMPIVLVLVYLLHQELAERYAQTFAHFPC